jgi:hypothetical protein
MFMLRYLTKIFFAVIISSSPLIAADMDDNKKVLDIFNKKLDSIGLQFIIPDGFQPSPVFDSDDVVFYYAIRYIKKKTEIRYSIFPYEPSIKEPNKVQIGSDNYHKAFTYTVVVNIAGDEKNIKTFKHMHDDIAKKGFNADYGYIAIVKPESGFGKGYKNAMIVGLYKSGFGFSYHTILFDESGSDENVLPQFYSVRFKDKK